MKQVAQTISLILNPFVMPFLGVLLVLKYHGYFSVLYRQEMVNTLLLLGGLLTIVFPLLSIYVLYKSKLVSDLNLSKKEERTTPAIITLCYFFAYYYFLSKIEGLNYSILAGFLGGCVALVISIIITPRWKISLHSQGISSLAGMFVGVTQVTFINHQFMILVLLLAVGLVGTSRLILHKHTPAQVYAGAILGFVVPYLFIVNEWTVIF